MLWPDCADEQLQDPVPRVEDDPAEEPAERPPVEPRRLAGQVDDADDQEPEVEQPLGEPLPNWSNACVVSRLKKPIR